MNKPALCQESSRSERETGGLDFLSFLVWAPASGHKVGQPAFFRGISSQATLLVSENKPQILLKCLHMWISAILSFQFQWVGLKGTFVILSNTPICFLAESSYLMFVRWIWIYCQLLSVLDSSVHGPKTTFWRSQNQQHINSVCLQERGLWVLFQDWSRPQLVQAYHFACALSDLFVDIITLIEYKLSVSVTGCHHLQL